jgi:hypothetical protein
MHTFQYEVGAMPFSLSDRLQAERDRWFTGRTQEYTLFQSAVHALLHSDDDGKYELPFHILHLYGVGGIGKTTLLRQFVRFCESTSIQSIYLDARNLEPSPQAFIDILNDALGRSSSDLSLEQLVTQLSQTVLMIDTYETLEPIDDWFRETFLPHLPTNTLIVLASRLTPKAAWQTDPGWRSLIRTVPLRNLSPAESQSYLTCRHVPLSDHQAILDFTHGHPLALSLMVDVSLQTQDYVRFQPEAEIDIVKTLLKRFIEAVPTPTHRTALEACALVRILTEALLQELLELPDAHDLFEWLCSLSFIESNSMGIFPHDLAREVLMADLRWRNLVWYAKLHDRARTYYILHLRQTQGQAQHHHVLFDYIFLHWNNPCVRQSFSWHENTRLISDTIRAADREILTQMVEKHEGKTSAQILSHWLNRQPQRVIVIRNVQHQITGFVMPISLEQATLEDLEVDPGAIACWQYLQQYALLRLGESATLFRFWMANETYQGVSPTQTLIFINLIQYYRNTPGLAFTFIPFAQPNFWQEMFTYADFTHLPKADFEVDGKSYGVYGHDWRVMPPAAWQALLARREIVAISEEISATASSQQTETRESLLVLSQSEFAEAVQMALRQFLSPVELSQNLLLRSRLVREVKMIENTPDSVSVLQKLLREAVESLQSSPHSSKFYRVLHRTYLQPAATQEAAAEALSIPFSTYRRYLKAGVHHVTDMLWRREIGGLTTF